MLTEEPSLAWSLLIVSAWLLSLGSAAADVLAGRTHFIVRALLLRSVAVCFALNFASVAFQARGLIGPHGILPLGQGLAEVESNLAYRRRKGLATPASSRAMALLAIHFWRAVGVHRVRAVAWGGCALALGVAAAPLDAWLTPVGFALLYMIWHVYKRALGAFANLQWDMLLLECGALCALLACTLGSAGPAAATVAVHLARSCAVRLHCGAGVAKLTSGERRWWPELSALAVHHETQPLPTPLAPALHALPPMLHAAATLSTLLVELAAGGGCVPLPTLHLVLFGVLVLMHAGISASGHYGYFNLLSVALSLSLLHDASLPTQWLRDLAFAPATPADPTLSAASIAVTACVLAAAVSCALLFLARAAQYAEGRCDWFDGLYPWLRTAEHTFFFACRYSLFSNMTPCRHELLIEGTDDGVNWDAYEFRYKPGCPRQRPKMVPPFHMPRCDWRVWLVAQGRPGADWLTALLERIADGEADVLELLEPRPCAGPRLEVRARRFVYRFANAAELAGGAHWVRCEAPREAGRRGGSAVGGGGAAPFAKVSRLRRQPVAHDEGGQPGAGDARAKCA